MLVSVYITTYNRRELVERAINSVMAQNYSHIEIIVADDGSTDGTQEFISTNYPDIKYLKSTNKGVSAARNLGIRHSQNDWLAFLDSDDEWLPNKLEKQFAAVSNQKEYKLIHCDEIWIRNGNRVNPKVKHKKFGGSISAKS